MLPSLFSVFLDYVCNMQCGHCSVGSGPKTRLKMPRPLLVKFLTEVRDVPTARVIVFTGGECTIHKELLLEGISLAHEGGYLTRIVTNAWWAKNEARASRFAQELKDAGLDELNTSYDDFHAPFGPVDAVVNAVRAGLDVGLRLAIGVIVDENSHWNADRVKRAAAEGTGISVEDLAKQMAILEDYPTPTGTGADLDVSSLDAGLKLDMGCPEVIKTTSIHPNGLVKVCCVMPSSTTRTLTMGNLLEEPLAEILGRAQRNLLYWWIHMQGPKRILEQLGVHESYSSICHACHALLGEHRERLMAYLEDHKDDVLVDGVLLSDNVRRASQLVLARKDEIMSRMRLQETEGLALGSLARTE